MHVMIKFEDAHRARGHDGMPCKTFAACAAATGCPSCNEASCVTSILTCTTPWSSTLLAQ